LQLSGSKFYLNALNLNDWNAELDLEGLKAWVRELKLPQVN